MPAEPPATLGVLLAGGRARRMGGGDKCLKPLGGTTLLDHVIARAEPQCDGLILNANGHPDRFQAYGLPVAADLVPGYGGPLVGVLTGLIWAQRHRPEVNWIVTLATDTPFFPTDLVAQLHAAREAANVPLACAATDRSHPVFGLWPVALADDLRNAVVHNEVRKVDVWTASHGIAEAVFPTGDTGDPFFNVNTPVDLATAEARLAATTGHG